MASRRYVSRDPDSASPSDRVKHASRQVICKAKHREGRDFTPVLSEAEGTRLYTEVLILRARSFDFAQDDRVGAQDDKSVLRMTEPMLD